MHRTLTLIAAAVALGGSAHAATLTTTDWGSHDLLELASPHTAVGGFEDGYLFTLPTQAALYSVAVSNDLSPVLGLSHGTVRLFREDGAVDTELGSYTFGPDTGQVKHGFGSPLAGAYYYLVSGHGIGSQGGAYMLSSTVSAVPEPQTAMLLLAGLGAMVFMAKRRRAS